MLFTHAKARVILWCASGLDIVTDRPIDYSEEQCFYTWTAWIVELLEKDDEAVIVVSERTNRLRLDRSRLTQMTARRAFVSDVAYLRVIGGNCSSVSFWNGS